MIVVFDAHVVGAAGFSPMATETIADHPDSPVSFAALILK